MKKFSIQKGRGHSLVAGFDNRRALEIEICSSTRFWIQVLPQVLGKNSSTYSSTSKKSKYFIQVLFKYFDIRHVQWGGGGAILLIYTSNHNCNVYTDAHTHYIRSKLHFSKIKAHRSLAFILERLGRIMFPATEKTLWTGEPDTTTQSTFMYRRDNRPRELCLVLGPKVLKVRVNLHRSNIEQVLARQFLESLFVRS